MSHDLMPVDFVARWLSFLGRLILIAAHAEDTGDDEKTFLSLRVGLVTVIGILFVVPTVVNVIPGSKALLGDSSGADTIIPRLMPLALLLGLALGLISFLGFLYNVRAHYPFGIWLLLAGYGILTEALWKSFPKFFAAHSNLLPSGAVGLLLLVLPMFYPVTTMRENRLDLAVHATLRFLRDPVVGFGALAGLLFWAFGVPYAIIGRGLPYTQVRFEVLPLQVLPYAGPLLAVAVYARGQAGRAALRRIKRDLAVWRVRVVYYLLALFLLPLLGTCLMAVLHLPATARAWYVVLYGICQAGAISFCEEIVWRGYLLNQCLRRWSPLTASLIVGCVFAVASRLLRLTNAQFSMSFALQDVPMYLALSILLAGWYHRTGSLLLTIFLQASQTLTYAAFTMALAPGAPAWYVYTLVVVIVPAVLILYLERNWFFGQEHRPAPPLEKAS